MKSKVNKEDVLMWAMKITGLPAEAEAVLGAAEKIRAWMDEGESLPCEHADVVGERDRARSLAARLEQENAELEDKLAQVALISARSAKALLEATAGVKDAEQHLIRGILMDLTRQANQHSLVVGRQTLLAAIDAISDRYGVSL